jgi:hypothetical protein
MARRPPKQSLDDIRRSLIAYAQLPDWLGASMSPANYHNGGYSDGDVLNDIAEADGSDAAITAPLDGNGGPCVNGTSGAMVPRSPIMLYPGGTPGGELTITGFEAADWITGATTHEVILVNGNTANGGSVAILTHEDPRSLAANRIHLPGKKEYRLSSGEAVMLRLTGTRWRVVGPHGVE